MPVSDSRLGFAAPPLDSDVVLLYNVGFSFGGFEWRLRRRGRKKALVWWMDG